MRRLRSHPRSTAPTNTHRRSRPVTTVRPTIDGHPLCPSRSIRGAATITEGRHGRGRMGTDRHGPARTGTDRDEPARTGTDRHGPARTGTDRHRPAPTRTNRDEPAQTETRWSHARGGKVVPCSWRKGGPMLVAGDSERRRPARRPCLETPPPTPGRGVRHPQTLSRRTDSRPTSGHLGDHRPDRLDHVQPAEKHESRQQRMGLLARPATHPANEDPMTRPAVPDVAAIARPPRHRRRTRRTLRPGNLDVPTRHNIGVDRHRTWPYDGHRWKHRLGPLPAELPTSAGGVPRVQRRDIFTAGIRPPPSQPPTQTALPERIP